MQNKYFLYYLNPRKGFLKDLFIIIVIIVLIILAFKIKTREVKDIVALYSCEDECHLTFPLNFEETDYLNNKSLIKYQNKYYKINNYEKGEPYLDKGIAFEDIDIKTNLETDSKIVKIKIYYKEERIIKKIKNIIGG